MEKHLSTLFKWKIESREEATRVVRQSGVAFLLLALLKVLFGLFLLRAALIDAALYAVLALALMLLKSRAVAITLLLLATLALFSMFLTRLGPVASGGRNISLTLVAARAVYATFALHGRPVHPLLTLRRPSPPFDRHQQ